MKRRYVAANRSGKVIHTRSRANVKYTTALFTDWGQIQFAVEHQELQVMELRIT